MHKVRLDTHIAWGTDTHSSSLPVLKLNNPSAALLVLYCVLNMTVVLVVVDVHVHE